MAARMINLLPEELRGPSRIKVLKKTLTQASFVLLFVYILGLGGVFAGFYFYSNQLRQIEAQNLELSRGIKGLETREGLLASVKNRIKLAKSVLSRSGPTDRLLDEVIGIVPPEIEIREAAIENLNISLVLFARSSLDVANFFDTFEEREFANVTLRNLTAVKEGGYVFTLVIR